MSIPITIDQQQLQFWYRDPLECIKSLYANPAFTKHLSHAPEKQYSDDSCTDRLYNEMNTGDWWWETQVCNFAFELDHETLF
jgi:Plavaka transposase